MGTEIQQLVSMTKEALAEAIKNTLGRDGIQIAEKIAGSNDTLDGLRSMVHQCEKIAKLTVPEDKCGHLKTICGAMLKDLEDAVSTLSDDSDTDQKARKIRLVKAKLISIASKVFGIGTDGLKITTMLRNAPESVDGLKGSLKECEKLASLIIDAEKVRVMKVNSDKLMKEIA